MPTALPKHVIAIPLAAVVASKDTQPRELVDIIVARDYRAAMEAGSIFPPVDVFFDGEKYYLADGFHRVFAARQEPPKKTIQAVVHKGTMRDAILFAVGSNVTHGRPRTNADKRHAVLMLFEDPIWRKWSDRRIAAACKVSFHLVETIRSSLQSDCSEKGTRLYTTRHGTVAEMDTTRIGKAATLVPDLLTVLDENPLRDDPVAVARLAGMDPDQQSRIAAAMAAHPEERKVQGLWAHVNRQENQRRVDNLPDRGQRWSTYHCSAIDLAARLAPKSIDLIITDPPYPEKYVTVYEDLSQLAAHVLKDGGLCVVMTGKTHLPTYLAGLGAHLTYHWVVPIILTQNARIFERRVFTRWKPLLVYANGTYRGPMFHDVIHSGDTPSDQEMHHWQQGEILMRQVVERFIQPAWVVLDPFMGSGTTGVATLARDGVFIGADIDEETTATARRRLEAASQGAVH